MQKRGPWLGLVGVVVLGIGIGARPAMAQTKEARGTVTSVTDSSLVVKAGTQDMTFVIDNDTRLESRTAARQTRDAKSTGGTGVKLTDFIKTGQVVLVGFKEAGGKNHADWVRPVATTGESGGTVANPEKSASGKVKAVTNNALTVTADGKDMVFNISADTNVQARGAGTQARQAGGRLAITDLVGVGDTVQVNYKEAGGTMNASDVRITIKAR